MSVFVVIFAILIATIVTWAHFWLANSVANWLTTECPACDIEGPLEYDGIFYGYDQLNFHRALHRLGRELMKPIERLINWINNKLTRKPKYEPAGTIHYGEFHLNIGGTYYEAYNQPDGTTEVWANGEHIGNYPKDESLWKIIDHAKDQK